MKEKNGRTPFLNCVAYGNPVTKRRLKERFNEHRRPVNKHTNISNMNCQKRIYDLCYNGISRIIKSGPDYENRSYNNIFNYLNISKTINQSYQNIQDITGEFNDFTKVDIYTIKFFAKALRSNAKLFLNIKISEELTNELNKVIKDSNDIIEILNDCNYEIKKHVKIDFKKNKNI